MNLKPIFPSTPIFTAHCTRCLRVFKSDNLFADLEGEPFKSYYCNDCAMIKTEQRIPHNLIIKGEKCYQKI